MRRWLAPKVASESSKPESAEKGAQQFCRTPLVDAAIDVRCVQASALTEPAGAVFDGPPFGVVSAEIDPTETGEADGGGAQGAGL